MLEILATPPLNSVQDQARPGYRAIGLCQGGAMDDLALALANAMLGNPENAAGIEIQTFPLRLRATADHVVAVTGADCPLRLAGAAAPSGWASRLAAGDELVVERPRRGARAYLGVAGGIAVDPVLGSRSTDLRNGFGGFEGRALLAGDRLPVGPSPDGGPGAWDFGIEPAERALAFEMPASAADWTIRVVAGPEHEDFDAPSQAAFWNELWTVTTMSDRMGSRLTGGKLTLARPCELRSGGILPGVVQVPPSGEPLIQLRDANSAGGYPRIGVVIRADLWRLAQARPQAKLRFLRVDRAAAIAAEQRRQAFVLQVRAAANRFAALPANQARPA